MGLGLGVWALGCEFWGLVFGVIRVFTGLRV